MPSGCRALSEPRPLSGPQCPCLWSGPDRADRTGRLWADRGGRVFIPSRPSGNEERGARVPAPTHWLVQPLGTGIRGAHHLPGEDSDERTREGPSAPLTPRGDRGPQQASRNVWWKQGVEGSRGEGCQRGQRGWASGTWLWGAGAGPQAPGSNLVPVPPKRRRLFPPPSVRDFVRGMREQKGMLSRRATFLWVERWAHSHCPSPTPVPSLGRRSRCGTPPPPHPPTWSPSASRRTRCKS